MKTTFSVGLAIVLLAGLSSACSDPGIILEILPPPGGPGGGEPEPEPTPHEQVQAAIGESIEVAIDKLGAETALNPSEAEGFTCYTDTDGIWDPEQLKTWCSGFIPGNYWFLHALTGDEQWADEARTWTAAMAPAATPRYSNGYPQEGDQDTGFQIYGSYGLGLLFDGASDVAEYESFILEAAAGLVGDRYNATIGAFRAWPQTVIDPYLVDNTPGSDVENRFEVNIDMVNNLEVILAAADLHEAAGDDATVVRYLTAVVNHFENTYTGLVREDGSTFHVAQYADDGTLINQRTHQGAADETTWSRGQAWAIYGHAMAYRRLGDEVYRERANELINYFLTNTEEHAVPYTDFDRPGEEETRDSSAAAITCSALMDLHAESGESAEDGYYISAARDILLTLTSAEYLDGGPEGQQSILWSCTERYGDPLERPALGCMFGDYFFQECMLRYTDATSE